MINYETNNKNSMTMISEVNCIKWDQEVQRVILKSG